MGQIIRNQFSKGMQHGDFVLISDEYVHTWISKNDILHRAFVYMMRCTNCGIEKHCRSSQIKGKICLKCVCNADIREQRKAAGRACVAKARMQRHLRHEEEAWHRQLKEDVERKAFLKHIRRA